MNLYHYTSIYHLLGLLESNQIKTTESNASFRIEHLAADVVWLTSNASPSFEASLLGSFVDKKQVRITVDVPAVPYMEWAKENNVSREVIRQLDQFGGKQKKNWHVIERPIPSLEWKQIDLYDYDKSRWVPYCDTYHKALLGKIKVFGEKENFRLADEHSDQMLQIFNYLGLPYQEYLDIAVE